MSEVQVVLDKIQKTLKEQRAPKPFAILCPWCKRSLIRYRENFPKRITCKVCRKSTFSVAWERLTFEETSIKLSMLKPVARHDDVRS